MSRVIKKSKDLPQEMVFGLMASDGKKMDAMSLHNNLRMDIKEYLNQAILPHTLSWVQHNLTDKDNNTLMQYRLTCHTSKVVHGWQKH